jgi:hypothetical protein
VALLLKPVLRLHRFRVNASQEKPKFLRMVLHGIARRAPISDNLFCWLEPCVGRKGYVYPPRDKQWRPDNERRRILALLRKEKPQDAAGNPIALEYPDNGFRHSYISNRIAIVRSMAQVAIECGTSESRIKANYNSPRPLSEAQAYFAIFPDWAARNTIAFVRQGR